VLVTPLLALALAAAPEPARVELTVGDAKREALVYPPADATQPAPVVFVFHGHGGTMRHAARTITIPAHWPAAVVVYPQGLNTPGRLTDPDGKKSGWQAGTGDQGDRDLAFFDALMARVKADFKVDSKRVYATGHSNGGAFVYALWAGRPDVLAAVAPSAGLMSLGDALRLKPKPCLHVAGEADDLVKFAWQTRAIDRVKTVNGCDAVGQEWAKVGKLVGTEYPSKTGTPVVTLIGPGGHTFPADAPELIVKFFRDHPKPAE
jgi:polyhydroxybutyrate depolymerase